MWHAQRGQARRARLHVPAAALRGAALAGAAALLTAGALTAGGASPAALDPARVPLEHVIVVVLENRSFDHLYGTFPGANGLANAGQRAIQTDLDGRPYDTLPRPRFKELHGHPPDERFPPALPNGPFPFDRYISLEDKHSDLVHRYYQTQYQINGGRMDRFVAWEEAGALPMGYWDGSKLPLWRWAREYTLADNFFAAAFGGSFLAHQWLFCACTPRWEEAPEGMRAQLDANGMLLRDGAVSPDGYLVNTVYPATTPHWPAEDPRELVPGLTNPTIGDRLDGAGRSWAWYMGGWNEALAGNSVRVNFKTHQQAPLYYARYDVGTPARARHLKDEQDFMVDLRAGTLPAVSFVIPGDADSQHPGSADVLRGERHVAGLLEAIRQSAAWPATAVIVTWDEHGGLWDHVPPPVIDRWGPGPRVPALIISPHARRGYVDHTLYDTTSILALIEWRWGLVPLGERDGRASNLTTAFDFPGPGLLGSLDVRAVFGSAGAALLVAALGLAAWQAFDARGGRGRR